jgi:hypothetical protein
MRQRSQVRLKLALCFAISVLAARSPARAQLIDSAADDAQYSAVVSEALLEFNAHRFEEARALFLKAHALHPNARTLRALGNVAFELRNYVDCIEYLDAALASAAQPLTPSMREETEKTLARAGTFTARVALTVEPSAAHVLVDGEAAHVQRDGSLLLNIGRHTLSASLTGYMTVDKNMDVRGGEQTQLQLKLPANVIAISTPSVHKSTPAATGDAQAAASSPGLLQRWWFWTALSAVVVGAGAGILVATSTGGSELQAPLPGNVGQTRTLLRGQP